ncbi:DUF6894 family protein [Mesorhizobium sp. 43Arga]
MALFFFDIRDGGDTFEDADGIECAATLKDVEFHAVSVLPDLAKGDATGQPTQVVRGQSP